MDHKDQDRGKGAVEQDESNQGGNTSMNGQLGHRDQDEMLKDSDSDFPEPGVGFKDIAPLLGDPVALRQAVAELADWTAERKPDLVLGAEARGFWLGAAIACAVGCGFVPARRPGKLPPETVSARYALEYGENALEVNAESIAKGARVVIHDDVLATGGTVKAIAGLVEQLGGTVVGINFVIDLTFLGGRERLGDYDLHALISY